MDALDGVDVAKDVATPEALGGGVRPGRVRGDHHANTCVTCRSATPSRG
jgi:hypothetical protein